MPEDAREFRAHTDKMLALLDRLREVERAKQNTTLGSAELLHLAHEAEELSRVIFRWSGLQLQQAEASQAWPDGGDRIGDARPRPLDRILANWREAQIRFDLAVPGTREAEQAASEVERLREEFRATQLTKFDGQAG